MEEEEDITPFWIQTNNRRRGGSRISSIFFNSGVFLVVLVVIAFVLVFVVIPSFLNLVSQIFRPHLIKKSWDSLNLVLVLFAIICGFLSRNTNQNNDNHGAVQQRDDRQKSYPSTPRRWYEYNQDRTGYGNGNSLSRLRSFSSYPDLRQESLWVASREERWRFYDDTHLKNYHPLPNHESDQLDQEFVQHHPLQRGQDQGEQTIKVETQEATPAEIETKDVAVDTFVTKQQEVKDSETPTPPVSPPFPPPPPAPAESQKAVKRKVKRTYHDLGNDNGRKEVQVMTFHSLPPTSPPPSPPPSPPTFGKNEKRRGKDILNSIRRKQKKQRQKSVENLDTFFDPPPSTSQSLFPPPSPPPPHFFQSLFSSKKGKTKKSTQKIPPPQPPPQRRKAAHAETSSRKHHIPVKTSSFSSVEDNVDSGKALPLRPIPPPPPPPPFKLPAWKFVRDGDFVRVGSFNSSRSGSPDLDSLDDLSSDKESPVASVETGTGTALFCPSPDVNTKADNFIARFRAGLKLEKINSVKGRSNLGPTTNDTEGAGPS